MPPKKRIPPKLYGPLSDSGEMQFPPLKTWAEKEREKLQAIEEEKKKNRLQKGGWRYIFNYNSFLQYNKVKEFVCFAIL